MFPPAFVSEWLQSHWWGFISRNYVAWPTFFLMIVFIALKRSHFWFLFESHIIFSTLEMHCLQKEKSLSLTFFKTILFPEGSCEYVMKDHGLLNISAIAGKWFRKFEFKLEWSLVHTAAFVRNALDQFGRRNPKQVSRSPFWTFPHHSPCFAMLSLFNTFLYLAWAC